MFYAMIAIVSLDVPQDPLLTIVTFIMLASLLIHGGSVGLFHVGLSRTATNMSNISHFGITFRSFRPRAQEPPLDHESGDNESEFHLQKVGQLPAAGLPELIPEAEDSDGHSDVIVQVPS